MAAKMDQNGIQRLQNGLQEGVGKRYKKRSEKGHARRYPPIPCGPLKEHPRMGGKGHPNSLRDTPLVRQAHGGGLYIYIFSVEFGPKLLGKGPNGVIMGDKYSQTPYGDFWTDSGNTFC